MLHTTPANQNSSSCDALDLYSVGIRFEFRFSYRPLSWFSSVFSRWVTRTYVETDQYCRVTNVTRHRLSVKF